MSDGGGRPNGLAGSPNTLPPLDEVTKWQYGQAAGIK
jgi:hypothetical protein